MIELIQLIIERYRYHSSEVLSRASPPLTPVGGMAIDHRDSERAERSEDLDRSERRKGPLGTSTSTFVSGGGTATVTGAGGGGGVGSSPPVAIPPAPPTEEDRNRYIAISKSHEVTHPPPLRPQVCSAGRGHQDWFELHHQVPSRSHWSLLRSWNP
jgi:hypothetical protein